MNTSEKTYIQTLGVKEINGKLKLIASANGKSVSLAEFYGEDEAEVFVVFMENVYAAFNEKPESKVKRHEKRKETILC